MARKQSKRLNKNKGEREPQELPIMPDHGGMEKILSDFQKLLREQEFDSIEEANVFLDDQMVSGEPFSMEPETPLQQAQELIYEAWESTGKKRVRLARKALKISADCADAYVLLAEEAARSLEEAAELNQKGVQAGERAIGDEMFTEGAGHFWGILETRPYMRARAGLAQCLWLLGERAVAINHLQEMLHFNPGDNQGLRYTLSHWLFEEYRDSELTALLNDYDEDAAADWAYTKALLAFRQSGPSRKTQRLLNSAFDRNPYVPEYLLGDRELPDQLPFYVGFGDESEAIGYTAAAAPLWVITPGALDWLTEYFNHIKSTLSYAEPGTLGNIEHLFNLDMSPEWPDDDDLEEYEPDFPAFELEQFLTDLGFPTKEHAGIRRGLGAGLEKYYYDIYGYHKYGRRPDFLIDERMQEPHIFGYGALEILKNKRVSTASKLKICQYAVENTEPDLENGVPYGLITLLGFMAAEDELPGLYFYKGMLALQFGVSGTFFRPIWMEGGTKETLISLVDWLGANEEIAEEEELWWIWQLGGHSDGKPHLGKPMASHWLARPEVSDELKESLCWAWLLDDEQVGEPPVVWLLMAAIMNGDLEQIKEILENTGIDPEELPLPDLDDLPLQEDKGEFDFSLEFYRQRRYFLFTPPFIKRLAIPALVRLGEDFEELAETFWDNDREYDRDALNAGIADVLEEFNDRFPPAQMRQWIERGINYSRAATRKRFYALSTEYYGNEYLERALEDNAKSIRTWAAKKLR